MESMILTRRDGVATITIDRPQRKNALADDHFVELTRLVADVASTPQDRVLVITGAGGDFCAGADLKAESRGDNSPQERLAAVGLAARTLHDLSKPTIAKVDGVAVGAGANLALCCDLIVASERARFAEIFSQRGLSLDFGGSWLLPRCVGMARAKELAYFGDIIGASTMLELGLVNRVVPVAELDDVVAEWSQRLASGAPIALAQTKALLYSAQTSTFAEALDAEARAQVVNLATADAREALEAFVAKRSPHFEGR